MPFNPDDYLAKKQNETATPSTGASQAFDPNAYLTTKGVETLPNQGNIQDGATAAKAYDQSDRTGYIPAAVLGFEQGVTYNGAKKLAGAIDAPSAAAFDENQSKYPITYALGQIGGALVSPNPFGKIGAVKKAGDALREAGVLGKMAINVADFGSRVGLSSLGASEAPSLGGKLEDVQKDLTSPLTIGLGALAGLAPALPAILRRSGQLVVKNGDKAVALGKGMEDALASEAGQTAVSRAVREFEDQTIQASKVGVKALGETMDQVAAQNGETIVNASSPLKRVFDWAKNLPDNELLDKDRVAKAKLMNYLNGQDEALGAAGGANAAPFQKIYEMKKDLGRLIFDPETGAARTFANAPDVKREAVTLYNNLRSILSKSDTTKTFDEVSKAFSGVYRTMDAADNIGNSLTNMTNKLHVTSGGKRDAIEEAYRSIPPQYIGSMPDLTNLITKKMDDVITAYNISAKIAGKAPQKADLLSQFSSKIPLISEGSRLNLLNQLGQVGTGGATSGIMGYGIQAADKLTQPNALRSLSEPARGGGGGALNPVK